VGCVKRQGERDRTINGSDRLLQGFLGRSGAGESANGQNSGRSHRRAEEVVGAAILLASPAGAYISGQVLLVDGARSVT